MPRVRIINQLIEAHTFDLVFPLRLVPLAGLMPQPRMAGLPINLIFLKEYKLGP